ncbi:MAG: hypothetical protein QNJ13_16850 [Paracoccaceae bacterium]|nr:hypothetical protein [Paracoccaceae bacterium]
MMIVSGIGLAAQIAQLLDDEWLPLLGCMMVAGGILAAPVLERTSGVLSRFARSEEHIRAAALAHWLYLAVLFVLLFGGTLIWGFGELLHQREYVV